MITKCETHPKYKGVMTPRVDCKDCWLVFRNKAVENTEKTLARIQKKCKHKRMVECEYQPNSGWRASPPRRVCLDCGLAEDGWGPGYLRLRTKHEYTEKLREVVPLVHRDTVNKYAETFSDKDTYFIH